MKRILEVILSFIITIIILAGILFIGWIIYTEIFDSNQVSTVNTGDTMVSVEEGKDYTEKNEKLSIGDTIKELFTSTQTPEIETYSTEDSIGKHFYEQLSESQKKIYNGLQANMENMMTGTYQIQFGDKFTEILEQENGSKVLGDDYQSAIEAFTHDNPDLFYIDVSKMFLNIETKKRAFKTTYNVYIKPEEEKTYFADGFSSETDVREALSKIENEKNLVKSKLTGNKYKDVKMIHDYLIDNIEYDENEQSIGSYTIYGALVEKRCVCEGYARAFKYLTDMAGIDCLLMQGIAINKDGVQEKHAWNTVKINNSWYLVDTTWDDPIILGTGIVLSSTHYKYFLKGTQFFYKDHKLEYTFSNGGKTFSYPEISVNDY